MYDVLIVGAGPAGMACGVYTGRGGLKTLILEKLFTGGQVTQTYAVDNYPGMPDDVTGVELSEKLAAHARKFGAEIRFEDVRELFLEGDVKKAVASKGTYEARAIVLAMGAQPRELGLARERELCGAGVSYCATCDGAFYRGKTACVVGGGDTALEDAAYLSRICAHVHLIHRRDTFRGHKKLADQVRSTENVTLHMDTVPEEILGERTVQGVRVKNVKTGATDVVPADGLFIAVGTKPNTELLAGDGILTPDGYVITGDDMQTRIPNVYAVGDLRDKVLRQIITATSDGAVAGYHLSTRL